MTLLERLEAPAYWMSGSSDGHEGDNDAPREAAKLLRAIVAGLLRHYPAGPWYQPDGEFAGQCSCGRSFSGSTFRESKRAWADHALAALEALS